jgi:TRAP-type mannitol/chloroaromatic compound transport system permease small subunit
MSGSNTDSKKVVAITDPGELNRDQHLWGDRLIVNLGNVFAWLFPILMVVIVTQVTIRTLGRYDIGPGNQAWMDDLQWWLYGLAMFAGFGYAITTDSHVRVDIFHANYSRGKQARIEVFGLGWLLLPFLFIITDVMLHYAFSSIETWEGSDSPNGLHMLFLLKTAVPILLIAAIISNVATLYRNLAKIVLPTTWTMILAGLPGWLFLAERGIYYGLWWIVRLGDSELSARNVGKSPMLENTLWYAVALILVIALVSFVLGRQKAPEA